MLLKRFLIPSTFFSSLALGISLSACNLVIRGGAPQAQSGISPTLSPASKLMSPSAQVTFTATGGVAPYAYSIQSGTGSIHASTGLFTAPSTAEINTVKVTGSDGGTATATVFVLDPQKLVGTGTNGRVAGDVFGSDDWGSAIAIDQDTLVIGAWLQDTDENGANAANDAGAAYVFTRSGASWSFQQKLVGSGVNGRVADDEFGVSVGISGDTVIVGALFQGYDENGGNFLNDAGAAYIFTRAGTTWSLQQKIVGSGVNGRVAQDQFGENVAIHNDTVVVAAVGQDYDETGANALASAGAAYVFTRSGTTWSLQQKLVGSGVNGRIISDVFGSSISVYGDTIAVGSINQDYDESGANLVGNAGAAYVFTRSGTTWSLQQKIVGSGVNGRGAGDNFGNSVSLSGDTLVVGAPNQGYDEAGGNFLAQAGAAYVYSRSASTWSLQQKIVGAGTNGRIADDRFGWRVSLSGELVAIGAYKQDYDASGVSTVADPGAAYVYSRSASTWSLLKKVIGTGVNGSNAGDYFGYNLALSSDGFLAVGAPYHDYDENGANALNSAGAAWVFY